MSYILDALQRSDSERAVGNIQTLDSPGRRPPPRRRVKRRGWIGWLVFLLLLLALLFALYFFRGPVIRQVEGLGVAVPAVFKSEIPGFDIGHGFAQTRTASKVKAPAQQNRRPVAVTKPESTQTPDNGVKPAVKQAQQSAPQSAPQTAPQPVAQPAPAPPQPQPRHLIRRSSLCRGNLRRHRRCQQLRQRRRFRSAARPPRPYPRARAATVCRLCPREASDRQAKVAVKSKAATICRLRCASSYRK